MKRFLATAVTAALLATGGVAVAGAADNSGSSGSTDKPAATSEAPAAAANGARAGHPRMRARLAKLSVTTAAEAIGITPKDLLAEIKGGKTVAQVAQAHNVDAKTVEDAVAKAINDKIDAAVAAGKLDAEKAAKLEAAVDQRVKTFVEKTPKHARNAKQRLGRGLVTTAAKAIGVAPKDLVAELKAGKSVAQVAQAHNVEPQAVIDAIVTAGTQRLTKAAEQFVNKTR